MKESKKYREEIVPPSPPCQAGLCSWLLLTTTGEEELELELEEEEVAEEEAEEGAEENVAG